MLSDRELRSEFDNLTGRIAGIRERVMSSPALPDPGLEQLRKQSFAATVGLPDLERQGRATAHCFRHQALCINADELLVGSTGHTQIEPVDIDPELVPTPTPLELPPSVALFFEQGMLRGAGNHTTTDFETILAIGFDGLIAKIDHRLARLSGDEDDCVEKRDFLKALRIVARSLIDLAERYADHALALAQETQDPQRKWELEVMSRNCRAVPAGPAGSFWEACQSAYFTFFLLSDAPGRVDQYLFPYYQRDIENGVLSRESALELIECFWLRFLERHGSRARVGTMHHITLGGLKPDGSDATNELTSLCLDATEALNLPCPQVSLRWSRHTPPAMLKRAVSVLRSGTGYPSFSNDEEIVPALTGINIAPEDARDYSLSGCNEVIISGQAHMGSVEGFINMPKVLAMTLGLEPALCAGKDLSALTTYKALWEAVLETMAFIVSKVHDTSEFLDKHRADNAGGRLGPSLLTRGCIERARGYTQGGARYNFCNWDAIGLANLADSLVAVKKLVFETQTLALAELVEILRTNWEGRETLRVQVLNRLPHFGNDCDEVDEIAADLIQNLAQMLKTRTPFRGGEYTLGTLAGLENMHVVFGQQTGATPDGRQAGEPLADSLGASQGRDHQGATAMLNSVAKMPARMLPTSVSVNLKLDPKLLEHEPGIEKIAALIQGHFLSGGMQLQLNLVNRKMLFAARKCPEQHANLMVRVAGYSGRFVALDHEVQDEVISRTEHHLATA